MRAGRRRKIEMAVARGIQADVVAQGRRRRPRGCSGDGTRSIRAGASRRAATHSVRSRAAAGRPSLDTAPPVASPGFTAAGAAAALARRDAILFRVWLEEALIMTRH